MHNHNGRGMWWMIAACLLPLILIFAFTFLFKRPQGWLFPVAIGACLLGHAAMMFGHGKDTKPDREETPPDHRH